MTTMASTPPTAATSQPPDEQDELEALAAQLGGMTRKEDELEALVGQLNGMTGLRPFVDDHNNDDDWDETTTSQQAQPPRQPLRDAHGRLTPRTVTILFFWTGPEESLADKLGCVLEQSACHWAVRAVPHSSPRGLLTLGPEAAPA